MYELWEKPRGNNWFERKGVYYKCGEPGRMALEYQKPRIHKCFNCGVEGHMAKDCPRKESGRPETSSARKMLVMPSQQNLVTARTYNMIVDDALASKDVVASIVTINSLNAYVIFDSGTARSSISQEFSGQLGLPSEELPETVKVEVANREVIPVSKIFRACSMEIAG